MKKLLILLILPLALCLSPFTLKAQYCGPYITHIPLSYNGVSNITISDYDITCGTGPGIYLYNCTNVHITRCRIHDGTTINGSGIVVSGGSKIVVDSVIFENVTSGGYFQNVVTVQFNANHGLNMKGIKQSGNPYYSRGQLVQFNNVSGPDCQIMNNRNDNQFYDTTGSTSPEDHISLYKSNGTSASPIIVSGNWLRGGGPSTTGAGITAGDNGGSYQRIFNNICVQTGTDGMQIAGGTNIVMYGNYIFGAPTSISHLGIGAGNYTPQYPMNHDTIKGNHVNWSSGKATDLSFYPAGTTSVRKDTSTSTVVTWGGNFSDNSLTAAILPVSLWPSCIVSPNIAYNITGAVITYGQTLPTFTPANTGGAITTWSITPSLPSGLNFNTSTGQVTGTPHEAFTATTYKAKASNSAGADSVTLSITVNKAPLQIIADNKWRLINTANPALTVHYAGFVSGETSAVLTSSPTVSTTATMGSPAGTYKITPSGAAASNYNISYTNGTLTIYTLSRLRYHGVRH